MRVAFAPWQRGGATARERSGQSCSWRRSSSRRPTCAILVYADEVFFFSSGRRHTRCLSDWSSDVCSSDLLVLTMGERELRFEAPHIYQTSAAGDQAVSGSFILLGKNSAGFEVSDYDRSRMLVIDPVFTFSTYLGSSGDESCSTITGQPFVPNCPAIAVDPASRVYVAGATTST